MQYKMVLIFESVDKILQCDHPNQTSSAVAMKGLKENLITVIIFQLPNVSKTYHLLFPGVLGKLRRNKEKVPRSTGFTRGAKREISWSYKRKKNSKLIQNKNI